MKKRERISPAVIALTGCVLAASGASHGASFGTYSVTPTDDDGQVVPGFYPNVELDVGYDDNILRTENNEESTTLALLKPELQWIGVTGKHLVRFGYEGEYARHFSASDEDYMDHFVGADITLDLTQKFNVNAGVSYRQGHENRGIAGVANTGIKPNEWDQWAAGVEAVYGRRIATAQIGLAYEHRDREYTNNGQLTRDNVADKVELTGYYNLGPKTQLLIQPSYTQFDYPNSLQDNDVTKVLVGVTWNATAKTTGKLLVGRYEKNFDNAAFQDQSGASWDVEVTWEPKTYSTVLFKLGRDTNDSTVTGSSSFESTSASIDWTHDLTDLTQLQAGVAYENDDYDVVREDDFFQGYVGISRSITRNFTVGARYDYGQRDSSVAGNDYDFNRITVGIKTTFD